MTRKLKTTYVEKCEAASVQPSSEFLEQLEVGFEPGRVTFDLVLNGARTYRPLGDSDIAVILETLSGLQGLRSISLPHNEISDLSIQAIASAAVHLTGLSIQSNQVTEVGIRAFDLTKTSLEWLDISQNQVGDHGLMRLILALPKSRLAALDISDTEAGEEALTALGAVLTESRLSKLTIDNPRPAVSGDAAVQELLLRLGKSAVTDLSISRAQLTDDSAALIAEALAANQMLTRLRLRSNHISSVGAESLAAALANGSALQVLDISGNRIGDIGAEAIAENLGTLKRLDVRSNEIHGVGLLALARLVPASRLTHLAIWGNSFTDTGVMDEWAAVLEKKSAIKVDFLVCYTDGLPYVARAAEIVEIWK